MKNIFILGLKSSENDAVFLKTSELFDKVGHNTGNLAFHYALEKILTPNLPVLSWDADNKIISDFGGVGVIPCANQIGSHANYGWFAEKLSKLNNNFVSIGLGAQGEIGGPLPEVPKGSIDWVREIIEHAPSNGANIALRGDYTLSVLEKYGINKSLAVLGCPTLFINPSRDLGKIINSRIKEPQRIAVTAGATGWKKLMKIERSLFSLVTVTNGAYIGQAPLNMIQFTRGEAASMPHKMLYELRDYLSPEMTLGDLIKWSHSRTSVFFNVPAWMEFYRRFDLVIGPRIHGVMLALQAGVPGVCIVHDTRTLELCQTMKVPYITAKDYEEGISRKDLLGIMNFDYQDFDNNRRKLANNYMNFLLGNNLPVSDALRSIASNIL